MSKSQSDFTTITELRKLRDKISSMKKNISLDMNEICSDLKKLIPKEKKYLNSLTEGENSINNPETKKIILRIIEKYIDK